MNRKIRFIWEAKNIDEHVEEIEFSERFQESFNNCPLYCGKFDREVSIYKVNVKYIHFRYSEYPYILVQIIYHNLIQ